MNPTVVWHHSAPQGAGRDLILLHGIGMSAAAWSPVLAGLAAERRVIAFDLPGFGQTAALPEGADRSPRGLAEALHRVLQEMGIKLPVDVAGNSLGGYIALEFARLGHARSVVLLSPAGLWRGRAPRWAEWNIRLMRWTVRHALSRSLARQLVRTRAGRAMALKIAVVARGGDVPAHEARRMLDTFAQATDLDDVLEALSDQFKDGDQIDRSVPCTVARSD